MGLGVSYRLTRVAAMSGFLAGMLLGGCGGAAIGAIVMAALNMAGNADSEAKRFAEVDRLAEQRRRSERAARVEANCDNGAVDDSMFV